MTTMPSEPRAKRWTRDEYYRLADAGIFQDHRVELIDGMIVEMTPQNHAHSLAIERTARALRKAFGDVLWIREQLPLRLGEDTEPEPDVAVAEHAPEDYTDHPTTALLVVEVSDSTLEYDRGRKANLYASADVGEYWVVNLPDRQLEVHRQPVADGSVEFGHRYVERRVLKPTDTVTPVAAPEAHVTVADLLP